MAMFGKGERKKERRCERKKKRKKKEVHRWYKESWWVQNWKAIHVKVRGTLLGQGPRQKLGIERKNSAILTWWYGKVQERD